MWIRRRTYRRLMAYKDVRVTVTLAQWVPSVNAALPDAAYLHETRLGDLSLFQARMISKFGGGDPGVAKVVDGELIAHNTPTRITVQFEGLPE